MEEEENLEGGESPGGQRRSKAVFPGGVTILPPLFNGDSSWAQTLY